MCMYMNCVCVCACVRACVYVCMRAYRSEYMRMYKEVPEATVDKHAHTIIYSFVIAEFS